jgi:hypothetical protein
LRELWADISPYGPMTGQTLSIAVRSSGIDRGMWNKRVAIDPQWAGSAIVAMATDPERSVIGERFRTRALEFQWDAVQQGIRAMVDEALPKMRMSGARFRQDRKREE